MITNQTVTVVTNQSRTLATNDVAAPAPAQPVHVSTDETALVETNQVAASVPVPLPSSSTNVALPTANNLTLAKSSNQIASTANFQTLLSRPITVTTNNQSITTAETQAISAETNQVVNIVTNLTVTAVTNHTILRTNLLLSDSYLFTELTPPPDFVLQNGESLVLLIDGVRHGLGATNSQAVFVSRKGFVSTLYKVPPDLIVGIASAREVKIRLKGINSVIEKRMSQSSRDNFKRFLLKYQAREASATEGDSIKESPIAASRSGG